MKGTPCGVYRYACALVRNGDGAEDITAQTFLRAWRAIGRYRWLSRPLSSWLVTIAHNLAVNHLRSNDNGDQAVEILPAGKTVHNPEAVCQLHVETDLAPENESSSNVSVQGFWIRERGKLHEQEVPHTGGDHQQAQGGGSRARQGDDGARG